MTSKEEVLKALEKLFSDRSYTLEQTLDSMREVQAEAEEYISALQSDIAMRDAILQDRER